MFKTEDQRSSSELGGAKGGYGYTADIALADIGRLPEAQRDALAAASKGPGVADIHQLAMLISMGAVTMLAADPPAETLRLATFDVDATPPVGLRMAYDTVVRPADLSLRSRGIAILGAGLDTLADKLLKPARE